MFSRFIHVVVCISTYLYYCWVTPHGWIITLTHLSVDGHFKSFYHYKHCCFENPCVRLVGLSGIQYMSDSKCWVIWNLTGCFPKWLHCFNIVPAGCHLEASVSPLPCQYFFPSLLAVPVNMKQGLVMLVGISLRAVDVDHLFICLLAICLSSSDASLSLPFGKGGS